MAWDQVSSCLEMILDTSLIVPLQFTTNYLPASAPWAILNALLSLLKPCVPRKHCTFSFLKHSLLFVTNKHFSWLISQHDTEFCVASFYHFRNHHFLVYFSFDAPHKNKHCNIVFPDIDLISVDLKQSNLKSDRFLKHENSDFMACSGVPNPAPFRVKIYLLYTKL